MAPRKFPGELAPGAYPVSGTAEASYLPRPGSLVTTVLTLPEDDGTVRLYLQLTSEPAVRIPLDAAVAVSGGDLDSQQINFPLSEMGWSIVVVYENTSGDAGTVRFWATDDYRHA